MIIPASPADLRPPPSPVAWSTCALSAVVVMLGVSVAACPVLPAGIAAGYSALAGVVQGLAIRLYHRRPRQPAEHVLTFLCGGLMIWAPPLPVVLAKEGLLALPQVLYVFVTFLIPAWAAFAATLAPASWLTRRVVAEGEVMGADRAVVVNGAVLGAVALTLLLRARRRFGLFDPAQLWGRGAAVATLALSVGLVLTAIARIAMRERWLARVRRGLVPGWSIVPRDALLSSGSPPRWDRVPNEATNGLLVFERGARGESFRSDPEPARTVVAVVSLRGGPYSRWRHLRQWDPRKEWALQVAAAAALAVAVTAFAEGIVCDPPTHSAWP